MQSVDVQFIKNQVQRMVNIMYSKSDDDSSWYVIGSDISDLQGKTFVDLYDDGMVCDSYTASDHVWVQAVGQLISKGVQDKTTDTVVRVSKDHAVLTVDILSPAEATQDDEVIEGIRGWYIPVTTIEFGVHQITHTVDSPEVIEHSWYYHPDEDTITRPPMREILGDMSRWFSGS